ncbi:MAG: aldehyde dehydrogenase family protein, partial [Verrucomicrobiales bacterium]
MSNEETPLIPSWIDGKRVESRVTDTRAIPVSSPIDGSTLGRVVAAASSDVDGAVSRAGEAFSCWSQVPLKERIQPLFRFKWLVEKHIGELSEMVTLESGKTLAESEAGIRKGLEVVEFAASSPVLSRGAKLEVSRGVDCYTRSY